MIVAVNAIYAIAWRSLKKKFRTSTGFEPVTSRLPVRCSTNWAMKPLTLGAGQLWVHMFPWKKWVLMICGINHIWTAQMKWKWRNDSRSERNLCNCLKKTKKNSGLQGSLNPSYISYCYKMLTDCEMNFFASNKSLIVRKKHKQTSSVHKNWQMF